MAHSNTTGAADAAGGANGTLANDTIAVDVCIPQKLKADFGNMTQDQFVAAYGKAMDKTQASIDIAASLVAGGAKFVKALHILTGYLAVKKACGSRRGRALAETTMGFTQDYKLVVTKAEQDKYPNDSSMQSLVANKDNPGQLAKLVQDTQNSPAAKASMKTATAKSLIAAAKASTAFD